LVGDLLTDMRSLPPAATEKERPGRYSHEYLPGLCVSAVYPAREDVGILGRVDVAVCRSHGQAIQPAAATAVCGSMSTLRNRRPSCLAASSVVPEPHIGSRTSPSAGWSGSPPLPLMTKRALAGSECRSARHGACFGQLRCSPQARCDQPCSQCGGRLP